MRRSDITYTIERVKIQPGIKKSSDFRLRKYRCVRGLKITRKMGYIVISLPILL